MSWVSPPAAVSGAVITSSWGNTVQGDLLFVGGTDGVSPQGVTAFPTKLAETILGVDTASLTWSSINQGYRNLFITVTGQVTSAVTWDYVLAQFNGDTAANYDSELIRGTNAMTLIENLGVAQAYCGGLAGASGLANVPGTCIFEIGDYARTAWNKAGWGNFSVKYGTATSNLVNGVTNFHWRSAAAITSIKVLPASGNFKAGTVLSLYGRP